MHWHACMHTYMQAYIHKYNVHTYIHTISPSHSLSSESSAGVTVTVKNKSRVITGSLSGTVAGNMLVTVTQKLAAALHRQVAAGGIRSRSKSRFNAQDPAARLKESKMQLPFSSSLRTWRWLPVSNRPCEGQHVSKVSMSLKTRVPALIGMPTRPHLSDLYQHVY
jgi:hypothetical protein